MSKVVVTQSDRSLAEQVIQAVKDDDGAALAKILAAIRETTLSCAIVRVERLFEVDEREQLRLPTPDMAPENEGGARDE